MGSTGPTNAQWGLVAGDGWGALAATAVVLPQAMAFGVTLFAPTGVAAATGALAGLLSAAVLCAVSGLFRGTLGLISAPTGPTLVLLGGAVATLMGLGLTGQHLATAIAAVLLLAGVFQMLLGLSGGGRLIKFIPFPVVNGFITGSAILMVLSQLDPMLGKGGEGGWNDWRWLPALTAGVTLAVMLLLPRWLKQIPGSVAGLVVGSLTFHGLAAFGPGEVPLAWVIGSLPPLGALELPWHLGALSSLPWGAILASGLALAILASLDTLLTSVVADVATGTRHDARRELVGQGLGQMVNSLLGGMAGAGTTGATVVAIRSGGRRWVGPVTGATFLAMVLFFAPITALLPISALAGIILGVALGSMFNVDLFRWLQRRRTRIDGLVALLVTGVTVGYDLMVAVGFGVALAVVQFVRLQVQAPVVMQRMTAAVRPSLKRRTQEQRTVLVEQGGRIVHFALRGNLFFGTADKLLEEVQDDLDGPNWMILDMERVDQVDLTAMRILDQMAGRLRDHGGELIFANLHKQVGMGRKGGKALAKINPAGAGKRARTFIDADEALEYAEDKLFAEAGLITHTKGEAMPIQEHPLCSGLGDRGVALLSQVLERRTVPPRTKLFKAGDEEDALYMVVRGEVDIILPTTSHHHRRLATFGPGTFFGEVAFLDPGPRTADAVATQECELLVLDQQGFNRLLQVDQNAGMALLQALSRELGQHLRWADREIHQLALH
ncbi:MAG: hypothetical protein COX57_01790 [Alphaproteobacteria bacterium CG_4_10_14_0_2_um_filter_63_37]|nr:MAG: hypothetical protein AUJ55_10975 [Proteobacteria bacterium CG1_02_64_396]PJA25739.1 MAG: hypothetical protein COX57_01790 [Alphaproteobacteria bacterium CG_4_10_14_0_2_um_filter_63_37]